MTIVTLHRESTSAALTLPEDVCTRMGLENGQELSLIELKDGLKLVRRDTELDRQMESARKVLREQADVLRELAGR